MAIFDLTQTNNFILHKNDIVNCPYSGTYKTLTLKPGQYKLECWGAQGGLGYSGTVSSSTSYTLITGNNYDSYFTWAPASSQSYYAFAVYSNGEWRPKNYGIDDSIAETILECKFSGDYRISYEYVTESGFDEISLYKNSDLLLDNVSGTSSGSQTISLTTSDSIRMVYTKDSSRSASGEKVIFKIELVVSTTYNPVNITSYESKTNGGYSTGILTLNENTTLYLYTGQRGQSSNSTTKNTKNLGGFNGGGYSLVRYYHTAYSSGGGGGGASDIRINSTSLYARVIVAGGGGGGAGESTASKYGGGLTGHSSQSTYQSTQTSAGTGGSFGIGGNSSGSSNYNYGSGGGGGGWYGGGSATGVSDSDSSLRSANGGGSGYVYTSSTASNYPTGCLLNSEYYLTKANTIAGNTSFISPSGSNETGHSGNGYIRITVLNISGEYDITTDTIPSNLQVGDIINCPYSGTYKTLTLNPGQYKLECWGAQGGLGNNQGGVGGKGGYSYGILNLSLSTSFQLYSGGKGEDGKLKSTANGGWNGGGASLINTSLNSTSGGGGGASDIRINSTSLYARVIVAGGGGGGGCFDTSNDGNAYGGYGGGLQGQDGGDNNTPGEGGTQTEGASFGIGGNGISMNDTTTGAGGGGGWYGGFGSKNGNSAHNGGGGGGSGYVYTSSTASNYPSGCLLNSEYYLTKANTVAGNETIISPSGFNETGHSGNGYIRITFISAEVKPYFTIYSKINNNWRETLDLFFKYNNNWINCSELKIKINNTWK